jgi:6-oxo-cyclohex-1-ene-carbonyl-CoA hydrolase
MALDWLVRDNEPKDHNLFGEEFFGTEPPCTMFEKKPLLDPKGNEVEGLYTAWITLNNPVQYNSYTTQMVKGVIAGFHRASMDKTVVATIFTAAGDRAFCTGGNTKEYAEYYTRRPKDYADYMDLFSNMVDGILKCRTPVICRCNGMRIAGDGGSSDFLPWNLTIEQAMWNCVSNMAWSAYKMERLGLITKALPIKKDKEGNWVRDPRVITENYVDNGEIVYGEYKAGEEAKKGTELLKSLETDFSLLDTFINNMAWTFANLMPLCLMKTIETIRIKKRFWWDNTKVHAIYWLAANMNMEAWLGFNAKETGSAVIDFLEYRRQIAKGHIYDDELAEMVMPKPK